MPEQARSIARVDKIAQNLRRASKKAGGKLAYLDSLEQAAQTCGYPTYNHAVIALPEIDPTPVPRS